MVEGFGSQRDFGREWKGAGFHEAPVGLVELQSPSPMLEGENPSLRSSRELLENCKRQKIGSPVGDPEESSAPLGLKLRKSPSLLDLIQMRLCQDVPLPSETMQALNSEKPKDRNYDRISPPMFEKLKASNFSAILLRIGQWERVAENEGDVVAKLYFAKKKLVWEILELGLKSKIEIQWSEIAGIRATFRDKQPGILEIELNQPPLFFQETNPQPRKHTIWEATSDFTDHQALICRRHYLEFPEGTLERHYEKLLYCDHRLQLLSQRPFPRYHTPFFKMDHEMQDYTHEFSIQIPKFPNPYNQPSINWHPSQLTHIGNPHTITTSCQDSRAFDRLGPPIGDCNPISVHEPKIEAMAMNSQNSVTYLPLFEGNAAMNPVISKRTPLWDQGIRNLRSVNRIAEHRHQLQGLPVRDCAQPAPNFNPWRDSATHYTAGPGSVCPNNRELQLLEDHLLSDPNASPCTDEQRLLRKVRSIGSLLNETAHLDSLPQSFDFGGATSKQFHTEEDINSFRWPYENALGGYQHHSLH